MSKPSTPRPINVRFAALTLSAAVVLALTACSKDSDESGGTTAPGTELSYGESATIERETVANNGKYTVTIKVDEPKKGTAEDLAKISELEGYEYKPDYTPYFVNFTVTYDEIDEKAAADLANESGIPERLVLNGVDQQATWTGSLSKTGQGGSYAFEPCESTPFPYDDVKVGMTLESCSVFVMYPNNTLEAVWFADDDTPYAKPKDDPPGKPVVWK